MRSALLASLIVLGSAAASAAYGQSTEDEFRRIIAEQSDLIRRLTAQIAELDARIAALESQGSDSADESQPAPPAAPDSASDELASAAQLPPVLTEEERREQERLVRAAFQRTLIDRGGLLLPAGTIDVQPALSYLQSSAENIVIDGFTILPVLVVGDIVSERVERELTQVAATFRFGLPWRSQLEIDVPFSYHRLRSFSADGIEAERSSFDLGDIDIGFSRQLTSGRGFWPDLLASLRFKSTTGTEPFEIDPDTELSTGTGYQSLNLALTGVKVVDPIVYFGSLSYSKNFARDEAIGHFNPGDTLGFSLGLAIALNLNSSLSFAYDQQRTHRSLIDGVGVPGSYLTTAVFTVGSSFAINDSLTADLSLGLGVTEDSPDVQLGVSFPMRLRR